MSKMELIEVNELKAYLVKLYSPGDQDVTETDRVVNRIFDILEVLPIIKLEIPNIGEKPHGKWVKIFENPFTNGYVCPFCGHEIHVTEQFLPKVTECEGCGADMRPEEDENGSI